MLKVDFIERITQNRVIKFFIDKLHYTYLGDLHDNENSNIMQERLYAYLTGKGGYSDKLAKRAIDEFVRTAGNLQHGLYDANKESVVQITGMSSTGSNAYGSGFIIRDGFVVTTWSLFLKLLKKKTKFYIHNLCICFIVFLSSKCFSAYSSFSKHLISRYSCL